MSHYFSQVATAVVASVIAWMIKLGFDNFQKRNKLDALFTLDAREGIAKSKAVLKLVGSSGGKSEHPWRTEIGIIREDELRDYLDRFSHRVKSRKISKCIDILKGNFREIFAASVWHAPLIILGEHEIFDGKSGADREADNLKAVRQLAAYDSARSCISELEPLLAKIERKSSK
jgi:hypothetical protein